MGGASALTIIGDKWGNMKAKNQRATSIRELPDMLRPFFWDYDFDTLSWGDDRELIIARVLTSGDWDAVTWLRSRAGDHSLREWIERHQGGGLSPQKLRFWELILGLPHRQVSVWLSTERRKIWEKRVNP
jgi:hypothetical protein